jgi:GxxExxY protein
VLDKIILEVKAVSCITDDVIARAINYLKVSGNKLALVVNFGEAKLVTKRVVFECCLQSYCYTFCNWYVIL